MGIFDRLSGRRKPRYWGSDEKGGDPFGFGAIRMHALSGEGKPHKETLVKFGPWSTGSGDQIVTALLREKGRNALIEFTSEEMMRIFNRPKDEVILNRPGFTGDMVA